jgi:prepilin signal peptidase PulO-like enzyme (type II secretory pathway)
MELLIYLFVGIFGAIIGSFLNVVILRYHSGNTFLGRSLCFSCGKTLSWFDLFPVVSFLALRGRCRFCQSSISRQYIIIEVLTGILFVLFFWKMGGVGGFFANTLFLYFIDLFFLFLIGSLLVVIVGYDIKHKIIPDVFVYTFSALSFFMLFFSHPALWGFLAGPIIALPFVVFWYVSNGRWMGFGDAKLALGLGWFLGLRAGIYAIIFSFWIGAIFGLILIGIGKIEQFGFFSPIFSRHVTMKSEIPFAPFLVFGLLLVYFHPSFIESTMRFLTISW